MNGMATLRVGALAMAFACVARANEPTLTVTIRGNSASYAPAALLALPAATGINVPADATYGHEMTYHAVPMSTLLAGVRPDESVRLVAQDGFVATLPAAVLFGGADAATAYLAIEPTDAPWPPIKPGEAATAGPFYVVWLRPEKGAIVREQWPYQIVRIETVAPLAKRFPMLAPAATVSTHDPVRHGFDVYVKNCSVCHTINGGGDSTVGPDLNVPYNPTEYIRPDALRRLIRDPQSLRKWAQTRMPAFGTKVISDRELTDLLAYLRYMADRKVGVAAR
jgi:mono/diheme cytochrome c family protein